MTTLGTQLVAAHVRDHEGERKSESWSLAEMRRKFVRTCRSCEPGCSPATLKKQSPVKLSDLLSLTSEMFFFKSATNLIEYI